jgi:hypothetical protein
LLAPVKFELLVELLLLELLLELEELLDPSTEMVLRMVDSALLMVLIDTQSIRAGGLGPARIAVPARRFRPPAVTTLVTRS